MTFYGNKVIAVEIQNDGIYLLRKVEGNIHMDYVKEGTNIFQRNLLASDLLSEFDLDMNVDGSMFIAYININHELSMIKISEEIEEIRVIECIKQKVYDLAIINLENGQHIFYMKGTEDKNLFKIYHLFIEDDVIEKTLVDEIEVYQIINPFRVIKDGTRIIMAYYYKNQICIKGFDSTSKKWSPSITLTDNKNKLYLDIMKVGDYFNVVYADYSDEIFTIKYERFLFNNDFILREKEVSLSSKGNFTDPILVKIDDILWVCWRESNQILSVYSIDNGNTWSNLYVWKDTKKMDLVKYKYLTNIEDERIKLEYSFGTITKDVRFVGFGDLKDAQKR